MRDAADAFAGAIASEDAGALSRVLARDVKRVFPGDSQRGRAAVLATYRGQFRGNEITGYELSDLDVSGGRAGRAAGSYELRRGGRDATGGRIVLGVKRERGQAEGRADRGRARTSSSLGGLQRDLAAGVDDRPGRRVGLAHAARAGAQLVEQPADGVEARLQAERVELVGRLVVDCTPVRSGTVTRGS